MENDIKNIFKDVRSESLSKSERTFMRNTLLSHMAEHPARAPYGVRLADAFFALGDSFGSQQMQSLRFVPATFAMVLVLGLGTAYAAEGALPGDTLYAVKLSVNEPLQGALAISDEAKASWHTEKIERRLSEAEVLVAEGRLTSVAQAAIEMDIHASAEAFDKNIESLARKDGNAAVAAAQSDLEASLIGHAEVLVALSSDTDDEVVQPIIRSVLSKAEAAQAARESHEATLVAMRDDADVRAAALKKKDKAKQVMNTMRAKVASPLVATSSAAETAQETVAAAESVITDAEDKLNEGDYGGAFTTFQEAIRSVKAVEVHVDASERLKTDVRIFTRSRPDEESAAVMMMSAEPVENDERD